MLTLPLPLLTLQAETWVSLEPGWTVRNCDDGDWIEVEYKRQRMH
jgi:hypothetical protein